MPAVFYQFCHFWSGVAELGFILLIVRLGKAASRIRAEMLTGLSHQEQLRLLPTSSLCSQSESGWFICQTWQAALRSKRRDSCLLKLLAAEDFLPGVPSLVGPTKLFTSFRLEYGTGLTTQHLWCLCLFTRLWRIWKRRSPFTCGSFIVCTMVVLEGISGWSGGVVFRGYTKRKQRCLSILYPSC